MLRRPPVGPVAPTAHDMQREYHLLSVINPYFPLAPKPVLLCEDTEIIGVPFYLMERRRGFIVRQNLEGALKDDLELRRRLSESVIDTLVELHAVDVHKTGIVSIGKPKDLWRGRSAGGLSVGNDLKTGELPEMEQVIQWLSERMPPESPDAAIVHNDFKLDNLMLDVKESDTRGCGSRLGNDDCRRSPD